MQVNLVKNSCSWSNNIFVLVPVVILPHHLSKVLVFHWIVDTIHVSRMILQVQINFSPFHVFRLIFVFKRKREQWVLTKATSTSTPSKMRLEQVADTLKEYDLLQKTHYTIKLTI